jgi:hypothetical protein
MDAIRKSPNYAEGQIRALLSDLKSTNHAVRMKAVKRFQDYITTYRPQIYDDDVDFLFCGAASEDAENVPMGLLYFCGLDSGIHENNALQKRSFSMILQRISRQNVCVLLFNFL